MGAPCTPKRGRSWVRAAPGTAELRASQINLNVPFGRPVYQQFGGNADGLAAARTRIPTAARLSSTLTGGALTGDIEGVGRSARG
jgi:hypothetical protein